MTTRKDLNERFEAGQHLAEKVGIGTIDPQYPLHHVQDDVELVRVDKDGAIYVRGVLATDSTAIVHAFSLVADTLYAEGQKVERARLSRLADHFNKCPSGDPNETNECLECREWMAIEFAHMRDQQERLKCRWCNGEPQSVCPKVREMSTNCAGGREQPCEPRHAGKMELADG